MGRLLGPQREDAPCDLELANLLEATAFLIEHSHRTEQTRLRRRKRGS